LDLRHNCETVDELGTKRSSLEDHVPFFENGQKNNARHGTTFPRSDIGEGVRYRVNIRSRFFGQTDRSSVANRRWGPREFSRRSTRGNSPKQAIFHRIHQQREIFHKGGIRGTHKRAHRFAMARSLIGRSRGGTSAIRGTHSHRRAIANIYGRGFVFNTGLSRFAAKPGVFPRN